MSPFADHSGSGQVQVVRLRFQIEARSLHDLLGLWLLRGQARQHGLEQGRLLYVADQGRVFRAGEPAGGGGRFVEVPEGVDESETSGLYARVNTAVGDLTDPLLRDAAALGDHVDELGVVLVHDRLVDLTLVRRHLPKGASHVLVLAALYDHLLYAVLVGGLRVVVERDYDAQ